MNNKIIISISIIITIGIVVFSLTQNEITEKQTSSQFQEENEISSMLEQIKQDKIKNEKSDEPYKPKEREWITSGPFQIDRSEYALGEKIFVNMSPQAENIKGNIIFGKNLNMTHVQEYMKLNYDSSNEQYKFYFKIIPDKVLGFCTSEELVGDWRVLFPETNYKVLNFKIKNQVVPGTENSFKPVC
jgi:hypothetical protein